MFFPKDGFEKLDEALKDLKKALEYVPDDKSIQLELQRVNQALAKAPWCRAKVHIM
jgi:hypothetical protein